MRIECDDDDDERRKDKDDLSPTGGFDTIFPPAFSYDTHKDTMNGLS